MGVGSAFNTALGGLNAYSNQVGYISDNLANVSTPGFKRVDATFLSYTTLSTPTFHSPGGVTVSPDYRTQLPGQVNASDNPTAFAITNGNGFAPVAVPSSTVAGVSSFSNSVQHYTRACDFTVDTNGYLVNAAGQFLEGLKEQTAYQSDIPGTPSLGSLTGVRVDPTVYKSIPGVASSIIDYNGNFPAGLTPAAVSGTVPVPAAELKAQVTSQVQFYDSLGNSQTLQLVYQKIPVALTAPQSPTNATPGNAIFDTASQWQLVKATIPGVADKNGNADLDVLAGIQAMVASGNDAAGNPVPAATLAMATALTTPNDSLYFTATGGLNGDPVTGINPVLAIPIDWSMAANPPGSTSPQALSLNYGTAAAGSAGPPINVTAPATGTTQYAGTNLEVRSVVDTTGQAPGSFQKASIDNNGYVVFSYSNGQQLKPYRVPLITFSDANKLDRVTGSVFAGNDTLAGSPVARWAGDGDAGSITPSAVEQSNVDIADELTKMIVAQRAYSSNGKVITTADEMIQEALGLKR